MKPKFEIGMYQDAQKANLSFSDWLEAKATQGNDSQFSWYNPDIKTENGATLGAFEQALMQHGIKVRGAQASTGEVFFYDPNARVLFPEFLVREFRWAETEGSNEVRSDDLIASRVQIDSGAYRAEYIDDDQNQPFTETGEGGSLPTLIVKRHEQSINLYKHGGILKMSYETIRRARLDHIATFTRKIALDTRRAKTQRALRAILNGDGNGNPAPNVNTGSATLTFNDLVDLTLDFKDSYEPSIIVADKSTAIRNILTLDVFSAKDSTTAGSSFRDSGMWPKPLGKTLRFVTGMSEFTTPNKLLLGVDNRFALEEVVESGSSLVETDRLVTTQFEVIAFSEIVGYAKLMLQGSRTRTLV